MRRVHTLFLVLCLAVGAASGGAVPPRLAVAQDVEEIINIFKGLGDAESLDDVLDTFEGLDDAVKTNVPLERLHTKAMAGDVRAQVALGDAYYYGDGVERDNKQATYWWRLAADQGNAYAQFSMGYAYANGEGFRQNQREAVRWWQLAADQGYPQAQAHLGYAYYDGDGGLHQDYREAAHWWQLAADQGDPLAQLGLGQAYEEGDGVPRDMVLAYAWYQLAATYGDASVAGEAEWARARLETIMNPGQIAQAQRWVRDFDVRVLPWGG